MENNYYKLENDKEYLEVDNLMYNDLKYILLSNVDDMKDACIRKIVDDKIIKLDDENEFKLITLKFLQKNKDLL